MDDVRLIDANAAIENADKRYNEWNLAMAAAEGNRQINMVYKKQELFKAVKKVVDSCNTIDPESLRPVAHWEESVCFDDAFWVCSNCKFPSEAIAAPCLYHYCPNCGAKMEGKNE